MAARRAGSGKACRVVLDRHARISVDSQLVRTAREVPTLVVTAADPPSHLAYGLRATGCEVLSCACEDGRTAILPLLAEFGRRRWTTLLLEAGAAVLGSLADAKASNELR